MQNLKYKIGLCNVFWNKNGIDTKYFNNVEAQKNYFLEKINGGANLSPLVNFNINDNISTVITYQDNSDRTIEELIACNYAVILKFNTETNEIINTRYFFAKASQLSGRQMRVELDLDDLQTNYFRFKNTIAPCIINRAHINRFINNNDGTVNFDFTENSHLFSIEDTNKSKRLTKREKLKVNYIDDIILTNWLNENVAYWVYTFVDLTKEYNGAGNLKIPGNKTRLYYDVITKRNVSQSDSQDIGIIYYPIMKSNNKIYVSNSDKTIKYVINEISMELFRTNNNDATFFYTTKISSVLPIALSYSMNYEISDNNLYLKGDGVGDTIGYFGFIGTRAYLVRESQTTGDNALFFGGVITKNQLKLTCEPIDKELKFNINEIINSQRNKRFNPKLLSTNFTNLTLASSDGSTFEYDISKINTLNPEFVYNEPLVADITKYYLRIKAPTGLYIEDNNYNYNGLVGSVDNSIPITNDQYANFIANNKNFWLQSRGTSALNTVIGTVMGAIGGFVSGGPVGAVVGGGVALAGGIGGAIKQEVNNTFVADNMRNAPDQLKNASGSVLFNANIQDLGNYIEIYDALDHEKQEFDDKCFLNGFAYGEIGNLADFDNIRTYFNYISADVEIITADISDEEKIRLIEKLKAVRFWNSDIIQYDLENYERRLLEWQN